MKHDNFKIKGRNPVIALLAMSVATGGAYGVARLEPKKEVERDENGLTELDRIKLQKAAEKRQRKCIKLVASKKNS